MSAAARLTKARSIWLLEPPRTVTKVRWPSGLRRQLKALVRKGVGSNPTLIILFCPARPLLEPFGAKDVILLGFWDGRDLAYEHRNFHSVYQNKSLYHHQD